MLQAVHPLMAKGGPPRTGLAPLSSRPCGEAGGVHGSGGGVLVPSERMVEGGTGGFHKCDAEQGADRVLMGKKKRSETPIKPSCPLPSTWESCPSTSPSTAPCRSLRHPQPHPNITPKLLTMLDTGNHPH